VAAVVGVVFVGIGPLVAWNMLRQRLDRSAAEATGTRVPPQADHRAKPARSNQPRAFRGQKVPYDAVVVAQMPAWLKHGMFLFFLIGGAGLCALAFNFDATLPRAPDWMRYAIGGIGAMLLLGAAKPQNLRSRFLYFFATPSGLYVHGDAVSNSNTEWLFVPWCNVRDIRVTRVSRGQRGSTKSIAFDLAVTQAEAERWFPWTQRVHSMWSREASSDGITITFAGAGIGVDRNLPRLQSLWADGG